MPRPNTRLTRRGFSFVEILFGVALLLIGATIVTATMPVAGHARERANLNGIATGLISKQLEAIRGLGYAGITPANLQARGLIDSTTTVAPNTYTWTNVENAQGDSPGQRLPQGTGRVTVETAGLDLVRVTVSVTYSFRGRQRTVTTGTMVANL